jgi:hypothetical protein
MNGEAPVAPTDTLSANDPATDPAPTDAATPSEPVVAEPVVSEIPEETWQQKYYTFKGKYDAEVPRLHAQIQEMNQAIHELRNAKPATPPAAPEPAKATHITDSDKEVFGTDIIDLIERVAAQKTQEFASENEQLKKQVKELAGQVGSVSESVQMSAQDKCLAKLAVQVPDFEALNVDNGFIQWLAQTDPIYGQPKQLALNSAFQALDADRLAVIFNSYKQEMGIASKAKPTVNPELNRQVAPNRSRSQPAPSQDADKPIWTEAHITQFYADKRKGNLSEADAARYEASLNAAIADGRVR